MVLVVLRLHLAYDQLMPTACSSICIYSLQHTHHDEFGYFHMRLTQIFLDLADLSDDSSVGEESEGEERCLFGICEQHLRRWHYDLVTIGVLVGYGLFGTVRKRMQRVIELLWSLEPGTAGLEGQEGWCLYCIGGHVDG